MGGRYRDFLYTCCPHTCTASPRIDSPHQRGTFVTIDEPTLTRPDYSKSMADFRVPSECCSIIHDYVSYRLVSHPKHHCALFLHPSFPQPFWNFYCLHRFAFSRKSYSLNHTVCSLFRLGSFIGNRHLRFRHIFSWLDNSFLFSAE